MILLFLFYRSENRNLARFTCPWSPGFVPYSLCCRAHAPTPSLHCPQSASLQCPCDVHVLSPLCLSSPQISCYICPIPMDKGGLNPVLAHVCLLVTGISWFHLQSLVSSLFLSVFRRAPPGKRKYKPVPVKTKSKRVQFRPLASESLSVFRLRPWHPGAGTVPSADSGNPGVAGLISSPKAYPLAEGYYLWSVCLLCVPG